jgi:putative alpha-1,2-mannosidase
LPSRLGIFPNAGQDIYLIGSPAFPEATLHLARNKDFVIEARNVSVDNKYVTAALLNGKPLARSWLHHAEIAAGGRLVLIMGDTAGNWGKSNLPPSASLRH